MKKNEERIINIPILIDVYLWTELFMMLQTAVKNHRHQHDYHIRLSDEIPIQDDCR